MSIYFCKPETKVKNKKRKNNNRNGWNCIYIYRINKCLYYCNPRTSKLYQRNFLNFYLKVLERFQNVRVCVCVHTCARVGFIV